MIFCNICPLKDVCQVRVVSKDPTIPIKLNWLPDGEENKCPLYQAAIKQIGEDIWTR